MDDDEMLLLTKGGLLARIKERDATIARLEAENKRLREGLQSIYTDYGVGHHSLWVKDMCSLALQGGD